jgi:hypothetical protein
MKQIIHKLKRLIQKQYIKIYRSSTPKITTYEKDCVSICEKLIKKNETVLLLTPISNKRYIKNEEDQIFVILENYSVKIINHVYSYTVILGDNSWNSVVTLFDSEVESRRNNFEKEITSNIKYSIKKILEKI